MADKTAGIPHEVTEDDVYEGYHIPKGSVIHPLEWSISRDPEVFPDPDAWNPLRWLTPEFPTYKEPLSKFPTISQYSQFGYGRRTCQGMAVTEADLFVGIGACAWLFSIHPEDESDPAEESSANTSSLNMMSRRDSHESMASSRCSSAEQPNIRPSFITHHANDSAISISMDNASLDAAHRPMTEGMDCLAPTKQLEGAHSGFTMHAKDSAISLSGDSERPKSHGTGERGVCSICSRTNTREAQHDSQCAKTTGPRVEDLFLDIPGAWKFCAEEKGQSTAERSSKVPYDSDPTMDFSTLLIAKPMPFKFQLRVRDQARAMAVTQKYVEHTIDGEFEDSRVYWQGGNQGNKDFG